MIKKLFLLSLLVLMAALSSCGKKETAMGEINDFSVVETTTDMENMTETASVETLTETDAEIVTEADEESTEYETKSIEETTEAQTEQEAGTTEYVMTNNTIDETEAYVQPEPAKPVVVCIDPGHGGSQDGTKETYDGVLVKEKDLNLIIAKKLKEQLEAAGIEVVMTRDDDSNVNLTDRVKYGVSRGANYFISVHINSKSSDSVDSTGSMVLMTCSHYQPSNCKVDSLYDTEYALATSVLSQLFKLGLTPANDFEDECKNGVLQRKSTNDSYYDDGSIADYYTIIYDGTMNGIPTILIEHAYLSNASDYSKYLSSEDKLYQLAAADAAGILNVIQ